MNFYVASCTEFHLIQSFLQEEINIGFELNIKEEEENYFLLIIDNKIASLNKINQLKSKKQNFYTYSIEIIHITEPEARIYFEFGLPKNTNETLEINENQKKELLKKIEQSDYSFSYYFNNADEIYEVEKRKLEKENNAKKRLENKLTQPQETPNYKNITEPHMKAQFILKEIANLIGENIEPFIASNDQKRIYKGEELSEGTLIDFPNYPIPNKLKKHLSLVDVIWFQNERPIKCFEVETSTSVYSGILRSADILATMDAGYTEIYIVTSRQRKNKIKTELSRPLFQKIGLSHICKVIFIEDLVNLYDMIRLLRGHIKKSILDTITFKYEDFN